MRRFFRTFIVTALVIAFAISCGQQAGKSAQSEAAQAKEAQGAIEQTADSVKADDRGYIVKVGDMVPEFDLHLLDGTKVPVSSLRGKVVMLQFTASWCGVCRKEMPFIESDIWLKLKDNPEFALYGIDLKEDAEKTAAFAEMIPVTYPLTLDLEGKIIMLTRLFDEAEFKQMVEVINAELAK